MSSTPGYGGWLNKMAALLHMSCMKEEKCFNFTINRLKQHPGLQAALREVQMGYGERGIAVYALYFPHQ